MAICKQPTALCPAPSRLHLQRPPVRLRALGIVVLLLAALGCRSAGGSAAGPPPVEAALRGEQLVADLPRDLAAILADPSFDDATWGVSVVSCDSGEALFRHDDRKNRQMASNVKLLTTAAALDRLGGDYRYTTELYVGGEISGTGLDGDLVIQGAGDPSLSPSFGVDPREVIRGWAKALESLGIRSIRDVVVDGSYFDDVPYGSGWAWDDEWFGFSAPISAASIFDNSVEVTVKPGEAPGAPVSVELSPATAYVTLEVTAVTSDAGSTSALDVRRARGSSVIVVSGNVAAGLESKVEHISMEHPERFFATIVEEELERSGIAVRGAAFDAREYPEPIPYGSLRRAAARLSPPLREIVAATNKESLNLAAEMILKKLGRDSAGVGSTAAGVEVVKRVLAEAGVDVGPLKLYDGSGLSRQDMIAPAVFTTLLCWAERSPIGPDFMASLPIAGRDGTLVDRMRGTPAEGNVMAKTGSMTGIRGLSGYARTRDGDWVAFSIALNNYSVPGSVANTAQDRIAVRLASFSRLGSP